MQIDPENEKYYSVTPYNHVLGNPILYSDPLGLDTIIMHRGQLRTDLSDDYTNVWSITFSLISNGVESALNLGEGVEVLMFGNKEVDENGDNKLNEDEYVLTYESMSRHPEWENTIRVTDFGVFIHKAADWGWLAGCKGICTEYSTEEKKLIPPGSPGYEDQKVQRFATTKQNSQNTLNQVRALYNKHLPNLSGKRFLLRTNSSYSPFLFYKHRPDDPFSIFKYF